MSHPLLEAQGLTKTFGGWRVLEDVSFSLAPGEVLGLVGRRGAGKTTLLNLLARNIPLTSGSVLFEGKPMHFTRPGMARWDGIELVSQTPFIFDRLNVTSNIFIGYELCWPPPIGLPDWRAMYRLSTQILLELDLPTSLLRENPALLSDEQRQLVTLARAFCSKPRLMLLDDFLASLSYQYQQIVLERVKGMGSARGRGDY